MLWEVLTMNELINQCVNLMDGSGFSFNICGGYALELFINKTIRPHSDLDMCIFAEDKEKFIKLIEKVLYRYIFLLRSSHLK